MASHLPQGLSPDAVDALTELTSILTRFRSAQQQQQLQGTTSTAIAPGAGIPTSLSGTAQQAGTPAASGVTGTTPQPTSNPTPGPSGNNTSDGGGNPQPFTVKDLPPATDNLKHKLQRARVAMRSLDDVQRSIALQEAELAGLEARRQARAGVLTKTQEEGMAFVKAGGLGSVEDEGRVIEGGRLLEGREQRRIGNKVGRRLMGGVEMIPWG